MLKYNKTTASVIAGAIVAIAGSLLLEVDPKVLAAAQRPGAMEKKYDTPFGEMSGGEFMFGAFMDNVVHGWDLAKATGQNTDLNEAHSQIVHGAFAPMMDGMRQGGAFGPEVAVADEASIQNKLLGMMGRQP